MLEIKHIFLISTPFHLKVAETISKDLNDVAFIIFRRSTHIKSSYVHTTIYIDLNGIKIPILKQFEVIKKIDITLKKIKFANTIELYYPNDYGTEFQYSLSFFKKNSYEYNLNMFEDGIGSYTDRRCFTLLDGTILKRMKVSLFKILLRDRFTNYIGIRATLAKEYYGFSSCAFTQEREDYGKNFHLLDHKIFTDISISHTIPEDMHLLLTSCMVEDRLSDRDSWLKFMKDVAISLSNQTDIIYIKPHPRESDIIVEDIKEIFESIFTKVIYIQKNQTIEEYLATIENKNDLTLYSSLSSALFYSKLFFPEINIISIPLPKLNNKYLDCVSTSYDSILNNFKGLQ